MSGGIDINSVPLTAPGGLVQTGGYMNYAGADRTPAVGITQMQPVSGSTGKSGGGLGSLLGESGGGEAAAGAGAEEAGSAGILALAAL